VMLARKIQIGYYILVTLALMILVSCGSDESQSAPSGTLTADLVWNTSETTTAKIVGLAPVGVTTVRIIISAPSMITVQKDFSAMSGGGTVDGIPPGIGRNLTAQGLNQSGVVIYEGTVSDLTVQVGQATSAGTIIMKQVKPTASPVSLQANTTISYIQQQLIGNDPNGDTLSYELISPVAGTGYSEAFLHPKTGMLYLKADVSFNHLITLQYHVTNGRLFSDPASVTIDVHVSAPDTSAFGAKDVSPATYSTYATDYSTGALYGAPSGVPVLPSQMDLSLNFPAPGNQFSQNSCVGWSTAYALKSYQERLETGWGLSQLGHLFSPAFIYHQINGGVDQGALIPDALQLIVNKGAATLATMPYIVSDYLSIPNSTAFSEAANYKAKSWSKVQGKDAIKAQLANKRPVVVGMTVYPSFNTLTGTNPVYNTAAGQLTGRHAVTIVGYDDGKYGGAFKLINSWGPTFGDRGYFWIPYSFTATVLNEAYVLIDSPNSVAPTPDVRPAPTGNLPDLGVVDWQTYFDPKPGGKGQLTYEVKNAGSATAASGFDVCLMLSSSTNLKDTGRYIVCEQVPFTLPPGVSALRSTLNPINFSFPDSLKPGTYYMSLWVDDLNVITESIETNNWFFGTDRVQILNVLPDLIVDSWYLDFSTNGIGQLIYQVSNIGAATIAAGKTEIQLVLSTDQVFGPTDLKIFSEYAPSLAPGMYAYRTGSTAATINMNKDISGRLIPTGTFYVALWVDPQGLVAESNEYNNVSTSWNTVYNRSGSTLSKSASKDLSPALAAKNGNAAYNGRSLPKSVPLMKPLALRVEADGSVVVSEPTQPAVTVSSEERGHVFTKSMSSADTAISPTVIKTFMPSDPSLQERSIRH